MEDRDFIDFKFGDHWASDFNLLAVSSGDRYSPPVYGSVNPNTAAIAGKIGVYKWKSQVNEKVFNISIAFDNINGQILNQIKEWLNPFKIDKLVFKEEPYKYYWVALNTEPKLDFLPFLEETKIVNGIAFKEGVYKGEFELQFVCFDNYGYSDWQSFDENYDYVTEEINGQEYINFDNGSDNNLIINKIEGNSKQEIVKEVQGNIVSGEYISVNNVNLDNGIITIEGNSKQNVIEEIEGTTVTGEYINVSDVSLNDNGRIEILGNSRQETREGYNLLNIEKGTISDGCSMTKISDTEYKITVKNTADWSRIEIPINLDTTKTYKASIYTKISNTNAVVKWAVYRDTTQLSNILSNNSTAYTKQQLTNVSVNANILKIWLNPNQISDEFDIYIKEPMLYEGTTEKAYEPYGAMPSFEFESEIETVGDNKNLFNKDNAVSIYSNGGAKSSRIDGGIRVTSVNTNQATFCLYSLLDATNYKNKTFTVRAKNKTSASNKARIMLGLCDENGQNRITGPYANDSEKDVSYTIPNELTTSKFLGLWLYSNADGTAQAGDYVDYTEIKLVEGTEVGSYSSYNCGSANVKVCNKNLLKLNDFTITNAGITATVKNGEINIKGTSTANSTLLIPIDLLLKNNTFCLGIKAIGTLNSNTVALRLLTENTIPMNNYSFANTYVALKQNEIVQLTENITSARKFKYLLISVNNGHTVDFKAYAQIEEGTLSDYIAHEEQNYTVDMQEEMLEGDYFDLINKKEVHNWQKVILTGNENIILKTSYNNIYQYQIKINTLAIYEDNLEIVSSKSNYFKGVQFKNSWTIDNTITIVYESEIKYARIMTSKYTTLDEFKTKLKELYEAGTPVILYYKLSEPRKLDLTEQQTQVLNQLRNSKIYQPTTNLFSTNNISPNLSLKYNYVLPSPSFEVPSKVESAGENINYLPYPYTDNTKTTNGITFTDKGDGTIGVKGTATADAFFYFYSGNINNFGSISEINNKKVVLRELTGNLLLNNKILMSLYNADNAEKSTYLANNTISNSIEINNQSQSINSAIIVQQGATVDTVLKPMITLDGVTVKTWSKYKMGSMNIKVCNKNLFPVLKNQSIEKKGITFSYNADTQEFSAKGVTTNTSFYTTLYIDEMHYLDSNKKYTFSITNNTPSNCAIQLTKINKVANGTIPSNGNSCILKDLEKGKPDGIMFFASNIEVGTNIDFTFKVQVEENTKTDYITHEEKNYTIDTQKPFKSIGNNKDCFVLKAGEWYERHKIIGKTITGEDITSVLSNNRIAVKYEKINPHIKPLEAKYYYTSIPENNIKSNIASPLINKKLTDLATIEKGNYITAWNNESYAFMLRIDKEMTKEEAVAYFNENPFKISYVCAEPIDIECTEQQTQILNQLYNNKIYKPVSNIFSIDNISPNMSLKYNYILPSPSFDVPSEIKIINNSININICSKNLLPHDIQTSQNDTWRDLWLPEGDYTCYYKCEGTGADRGLNLNITDKNGHWEQVFSNKSTNWTIPNTGYNAFTFKAQNGIRHLNINGYGTDTTYSKFMLVKGKLVEENKWNLSDINLYTDYKNQNFILPLQESFKGMESNDNVDFYNSIDNYGKKYIRDNFIKENGKWYERHYIKRVIADGVNYKAHYVFPTGWFSLMNINNREDKDGLKIKDWVYTGVIKCDKLNTVGMHAIQNKGRAGVSATSNGTIWIKFDNDITEGIWTKEKVNTFLQKNPLTIDYALAEPKILECTPEQSIILNQLENEVYTYEGANNIFTANEVSSLLSLSYVPKQDIFIDYVVNQSNLLNDSAFYYDNDIYKKSYFDAETGDATKSGISEDRPVYLYNAGTTAANLNLTFDMIIPAESSPLIIQTESCKLTDNGTKIIKQVSSISISNFSRYKPFLEIYDNTLSNWQIEINSDLCEIHLKHKTDNTKIISLNKFNDNQSFLSLANCNFVDYSKPFPTLITAINNTAIENTIFNKLSVASSAQNYRLKNVKVEWKHTYL